ncbi:MAG: hypothetical protein NUV67_06300, partial [archaeon]|nr:hypothetical protein [archaeon]
CMGIDEEIQAREDALKKLVKRRAILLNTPSKTRAEKLQNIQTSNRMANTEAMLREQLTNLRQARIRRKEPPKHRGK